MNVIKEDVSRFAALFKHKVLGQIVLHLKIVIAWPCFFLGIKYVGHVVARVWRNAQVIHDANDSIRIWLGTFLITEFFKEKFINSLSHVHIYMRVLIFTIAFFSMICCSSSLRFMIGSLSLRSFMSDWVLPRLLRDGSLCSVLLSNGSSIKSSKLP